MIADEFVKKIMALLNLESTDAGKSNFESIGLRFDFPADYSELSAVLGLSCLNDFIYVLNLESSNENLNYSEIKRIWQRYSEGKKGFPELYPRPDFPKQGSFFPFALTDNGDMFYWIVENGGPSGFVAILGRDGEEEVFEMSCSELLYHIIKGEIRPGFFPDDVWADGPRYKNLA